MNSYIMISIVLLFLLNNAYICNACTCRVCMYHSELLTPFLVSEFIVDWPCFKAMTNDPSDPVTSEPSQVEDTAICHSTCSTEFTVHYTANNKVATKNQLYSTSILTSRTCNSLYETTSRSSCEFQNNNEAYSVTCRKHCSGNYCNNKDIYREFIHNKLKTLVPTCRVCEESNVQHSNSTCLKEENSTTFVKEEMCFGKCFNFLHIALDHKVSFQRKCMLYYKDNLGLQGEMGVRRINGVWKYLSCAPKFYQHCNGGNTYIDNFKPNIENVRNISERICLICMEYGIQDKLSNCAKGVVSTIFNMIKCKSKCISFYIKQGNTENLVRGCEDANFKYEYDIKLPSEKHNDRKTHIDNDSINCYGCDYVSFDRIAGLPLEIKMNITSLSLEQCRMICVIMGNNSCQMFAYEESMKSCLISKSTTLLADPEHAYKTFVSNGVSSITCNFMCFMKCRSEANICNNMNVNEMKEHWANKIYDTSDNRYNILSKDVHRRGRHRQPKYNKLEVFQPMENSIPGKYKLSRGRIEMPKRGQFSSKFQRLRCFNSCHLNRRLSENYVRRQSLKDKFQRKKELFQKTLTSARRTLLTVSIGAFFGYLVYNAYTFYKKTAFQGTIEKDKYNFTEELTELHIKKPKEIKKVKVITEEEKKDGEIKKYIREILQKDKLKFIISQSKVEQSQNGTIYFDKKEQNFDKMKIAVGAIFLAAFGYIGFTIFFNVVKEIKIIPEVYNLEENLEENSEINK